VYFLAHVSRAILVRNQPVKLGRRTDHDTGDARKRHQDDQYQYAFHGSCLKKELKIDIRGL
jgi:hypothetical protein